MLPTVKVFKTNRRVHDDSRASRIVVYTTILEIPESSCRRRFLTNQNLPRIVAQTTILELHHFSLILGWENPKVAIDYLYPLFIRVQNNFSTDTFDTLPFIHHKSQLTFDDSFVKGAHTSAT